MIRERYLTRSLYIAVVLIFVVQTVGSNVGEPYPSLVMPSFAGDNTKDGKMQTVTADIHVQFCDGKERALTPGEFLVPLPTSHLTSVMDWMFGLRAPQRVPRWKEWISHNLSAAYGKRVLRAQGGSVLDDETKQWMKRRLQAEYNDKPRAIDVSWMVESYDLRGVFPTRSRHLISVVPVELGKCPQ